MLDPCHPCLLGESRKKQFDSYFEEVIMPGEKMHSDLSGKLPRSINGNLYSCTFTDHFLRYTHVGEIKLKSDTTDLLKEYKKLGYVAKYFPKGAQHMRTDAGGEYVNIEETEHTSTCPDTPHYSP